MTDVNKTADRARQVAVDWGERSLGNWVAAEFYYTDFAVTADIVNLITIPANSFVARVLLVIEIAFVGGTVSITVGDDSDAEGYLEEADVGASTAGNVVNTVPDSHGNVVAAYENKAARPFYTSADTLDVLCNFSSALTAGKATLIAEIVTVPR